VQWESNEFLTVAFTKLQVKSKGLKHFIPPPLPTTLTLS